MKKFLLLALFVGQSGSAFAQGWIYLSNIDNTDTSPIATRNGLFFLRCPTLHLIDRDFNVSFYGGSDSANLSLLRTFYGATAVGDNVGGPGTLIDLSGTSVTIAGATTSAFFRIDAWLGGTTIFPHRPAVQAEYFVTPLGTPLQVLRRCQPN